MDYLSLCLICKDENDYLAEWLDYHILMGVDRFYIYDNESQISVRETIKEYIEDGWVVVVDIPGKAMQLCAYDHCLQTFGPNTFWMGFIDTDEFLVPKTTLDLKELLKNYEAYGGLAVSSLFFGSNGHQVRPAAGQIAAYTQRTHATFKEYEVVKSIVQPGLALVPYSPHDFTYKENFWCVNEGFLRVDNQDFPSHTEKIQLNHYFCRSVSELEQKFHRGRGDTGAPWLRNRFERFNQLPTYPDTTIIQNLNRLFQEADLGHRKVGEQGHAFKPVSLLEKMAIHARERKQVPINMTSPVQVVFRSNFYSMQNVDIQIRDAENRDDYEDVKRLLLVKLKAAPYKITLYFALSVAFLELKDPASAWQTLAQAWKIAPNSYMVLFGMANYFLRVENFQMVVSTCHLLLEMGSHDLNVLAFITEAMIGQGQWDDALKIGVPVVELASTNGGELPEQLCVYLVKKMADYLLEKRDYNGAVHLWDAGVKCQPIDVNALIELSQALLLAGDKAGARQRLMQAKELDPKNEAVLALLKAAALAQRANQIDTIAQPFSSVTRPQKRKH